VRGEIIRVADGGVIDLFGHLTEAAFLELEESQGNSHRNAPYWLCGGCGRGMYIKHGPHSRRLFACHFIRKGCSNVRVPHPMSDEHKRQVESAGIAYTRLGLQWATEVRTTGRTVVDGVADRRIGFEAQHSHKEVPAIVARTRRSVASGLEVVVWASDSSADPPWTGRVPGYRYGGHPDWKGPVPDPAAVAVLGVQSVEMERVGLKWRPRLMPAPMTVQDIAEGLAFRTVKAVTIAKRVRLLTARGDALWRGHTGQDTTWNPGKPPVPKVSAYDVRSECDLSPAPSPAIPVAVTSCIWCRGPFDEESIRFKLTIHPRCADERADVKAQYRATAIPP
jgi:hypothetical protein